MKHKIELDLDEAVIAKVELLMAFYNIATMEQWITEMVEADLVATNELKDSDPPHLNETQISEAGYMDGYIGHDFGFAEEAK